MFEEVFPVVIQVVVDIDAKIVTADGNVPTYPVTWSPALDKANVPNGPVTTVPQANGLPVTV